MPRGKHVNHKGRNRRFTNPEELEEQRKRAEKAKSWRERNGELSPSESESEKDVKEEESEEESSSEEEESGKAKGVEGIIAIENPNRVQTKMKKLSTINETAGTSTKPQLTRREREEFEKQRAAQHYQKLHAEGKTDEARADLARLAIIRQQREEAAKKREEEKREKELAKTSKTTESLKAIKKQ